MATATKTRTGFKVSCIRCGETDTVTLDLASLETCSCSSCSEEFTLSDVRVMLAEWSKVLAWVDLAPSPE